jgi:hypothetical protein
VNDEQWSKDVAELVADALVDAGLFPREQFARATEIVAEEIWVRFVCGDYPPGATDPTKRSLRPNPG